MCKKCCKEFQLKHFWFHDCQPERFYQSQWCERRWVFFLFKFLLFSYWFAMFIVSIVQSGHTRHQWWIFLTHWGVIINLVYFLFSFVVAMFGLFDKPTPRTPTNVNTVSGAISEVSTSNGRGAELEETGLRWFHIIVWILHSVAFNVALCITVLYWTILAPGETSFLFTGINNHALNLVVMVLDTFFNDIPVRILHFYHATLLACIYTIFTGILHGADYNSSIYGVLDWDRNPALAAGLCLVVVFVALPLAHAILFCLFRVRAYIARTCLRPSAIATQTQRQSTEQELKPVDNPAYLE